MVTIPKKIIGKGIQATEAAKEAVAKVKNMVKTEVINTEQLLRSPASDLFEKKGYMETESFWHRLQSFANYARGQYLTEGGKAVQDSHKFGERIIEQNGNLERGFNLGLCSPNGTVIYYEKNLATGDIQSVELYNGKPYKSYSQKTGQEIFHNLKTGAPRTKETTITDGRITDTFAEDGETIVSSTKVNWKTGEKEVTEFRSDGVTPLRIKKFNKNGDIISISGCNENGDITKQIVIKKGTKSPEKIYYYENGVKKDVDLCC